MKLFFTVALEVVAIPGKEIQQGWGINRQGHFVAQFSEQTFKQYGSEPLLFSKPNLERSS